MKFRHGCLLGLVALLAAGCRTDPRITALEQELRLHEDRLYSLQDSLDEAQYSLTSCEKENESLRKRLAERRASGEIGRGGPTSDVPTIPPDLPKVELPSDDGFRPIPPASLRGLEPPEAPAGAGQNRTPPREPAGEPSGPALPEPTAPGALPEAPPWKPIEGAQTPEGSADNAGPVEEISLGEVTLGTPDGRRGSGMTIVVEPRDASGQTVATPAAVAVALIDPALPDDAGRVGRWNFSAEEVGRTVGRRGRTVGFRLALPWPHGAPRHDNLHLFVRYTTRDGRQLETNVPIAMSQLAAAELPREPDAPPNRLSNSLRRTWGAGEASDIPPRPVLRSDPVSTARRPVWSPERL